MTVLVLYANAENGNGIAFSYNLGNRAAKTADNIMLFGSNNSARLASRLDDNVLV